MYVRESCSLNKTKVKVTFSKIPLSDWHINDHMSLGNFSLTMTTVTTVEQIMSCVILANVLLEFKTKLLSKYLFIIHRNVLWKYIALRNCIVVICVVYIPF